MRAISRRTAVILTTVIVAVVVLGTGIKVRQHLQSVARGRDLFNGEGLTGRITGQSDALPGAATRCVNCHAAHSAGIGAQPATYAAALDRATLTHMRSRRGGPASRFDEPTLCALVRSGIDPAHIIIPQAMPRYDLADRDCSAIWDYLQTL